MPRSFPDTSYQHGWLVLALLVVLIFPMNASASRSVRVAWNPNPETNIQGYRIYYGEVAAGYTNLVDVGLNTTGSVTDLAFETGYFFYLTAYNVYGLESDPSTVLYYTTPPPTPISVTTEEVLLTFGPAVVSIPATLAGDADTGLEINWQQLAGPVAVAIQDGDLIEPTVQLTTTGDYSFSVQVSDDSASDQAQVIIRVVEPAPGSGTESAPKLEPPMFLPDGIALFWNSKPAASYHIGLKRDLNSPFWILLESDIPSQGPHTNWVDDSADFLGTGFYAVFENAN
jgi:hypothetical protein